MKMIFWSQSKDTSSVKSSGSETRIFWKGSYSNVRSNSCVMLKVLVMLIDDTAEKIKTIS